jgi:RNA polymerase sigma-70 factor, ECF subfamily
MDKEIFLHQSEAELVRRARSREQDAIEELYNRNQASVFTYVFYRVGDQKFAEDITSDVFVRMLTNLHRYKPGNRPILAWLFTIARNLVADHFRERIVENLNDLEERIEENENQHPVNMLENHQIQECLEKAMNHLTDEQRQVVILKFIEERNIEEVAAILSKTARAIRSMQHRALAALSRAMEKEHCYE